MHSQSLPCLLFSFILPLLWISFTPSSARAESITVSLSVGLTYFQVDGFTSPGAVVTIQENSSTLATTTSGVDGAFSLSILDDDGLHTYSIYASDTDGHLTATVTESASLTPGTTTTLGNLVLPPTVNVDNLEVTIGTDIHVTGQTVPAGTITAVFNDSPLGTTPVGSDGRYSYTLSTDALSTGLHTLSFQSSLSSGYNSAVTPELVLNLHDRPAGSPSSATGQPVPIPTPSLPSSLLAPFLQFDLDGDGRLTLSELRSILLEWLTFLKNGGNSCDLNADGRCNLQDFSILLYYIER